MKTVSFLMPTILLFLFFWFIEWKSPENWDLWQDMFGRFVVALCEGFALLVGGAIAASLDDE